VTENGTTDDAAVGSKYLAGAQACFAVGRFVGTFAMRFIRPRKVFLFFLTMCFVFLAPAITQPGYIGMSMIYITLFFESICFPTIMALGMRGLGRHTKRGSGWIVGGVVGGAVVPAILGATADAHGTPFAMVVPLCFFLMAETYALAVNFVPSYRDPADAFSTTDIGIVRHPDGVLDEESGPGGVIDEKTVGDGVEAEHVR
jgi:FHS family L-fucose permease-like MFS transporter